MHPKPILGLALVLGGGLASLASGSPAAPTLFPITEISPANIFTHLTASTTNADVTDDWFKKIKISCGFIDASGAKVIPPSTNWFPTHEVGKPFAEGLEPMQIRWQPGQPFGNQFGYLNAQGQFAIAPQFSLARRFSEGLAAVRTRQGYGYIDHAGQFVIPPQFAGANGFSEGLAQVVATNNLMGFIDRHGNWVVKPQFRASSRQSDFSEGLACVPTNDATLQFPFASGTNPEFKWGYLNPHGELVIGFRFKEANAFSEGLAAVSEKIQADDGDEKTGGHSMPPPFSKGGYIDKTGKYVIPPQFDGVWNFSEGLARVSVAGQMRFINRQGKIVFTVTNGEWADEFSDGLANVSIRTGAGEAIWGYINPTGQFVIPPQFQQAEPFYHGRAQVVLDNKSAYIDQNGHLVWKQP